MKKFLLLFLLSNYAISNDNYVEIERERPFNSSYTTGIRNELNIKVKQKKHYMNNDVKVGILDSESSVFQSISEAKIWDDHSYHIRGVIHSLAKSNNIRTVLFKPSIMGGDGYYLRQLEKLLKEKPDIVNLSLGVLVSKENYATKENLKEKRLIEQNSNTIFICAAGNEEEFLDENLLFLPASHSLDNIISVTSIKDGEFQGNRGDVDFGVNGVQIPSDGKYYPVNFTGSSQAAAIMTSAVIRIKQRYPDITRKQVLHILKVNSKPHNMMNYGVFSYNSFNLWMNNEHSIYSVNRTRFSKRKNLIKSMLSYDNIFYFNY